MSSKSGGVHFIKTKVELLESRVLSKLPGYVLIKGMLSGLGEDEKQRLHPVLAHGADTGRVGFEIERMADGRIAVLIPSSHNPWSGEVHIMDDGDVRRLDLPMVGYMQFVERFGQGADHILGTEAK